PDVAPILGLAEAGYLTNESAFELNELPPSLIVLGGRYVALECAQMFARFGSQVTILQRSNRILPSESADLTEALTAYLSEEGIRVVTGVTVHRVRRLNGVVVVEADTKGNRCEFRASHILVATGRRPNTYRLGLKEAGVATDDRGFVKVDGSLRTTGAGIFAAGDVIGEPMFVYTAAYEGALAAENALLDSFRVRDYTALPWVIFTDPQVAGVGMDEQQARQKGIDAEVAVLPLSHVPRCIAARDVRGFVKLIRDRASDRLLGARILAPEGSELLMELSLAIKHAIPVKELASSFHAYLTLGEAVKLAALAFGKNVSRLSCCAT
ncbi:MAG: dihydrolipoyl dehydrogenase family protein, partial [Armatimonadota bacterium]